MAKKEWSLFHDVGFAFYVLGLMAMSNKDELKKRMEVVHDKFMAWLPKDVNGKKIMKEVVDEFIKYNQSDESFSNINKILGKCMDNINNMLSDDEKETFIRDLFYTVNSASPSQVEINMIRKTADFLEVEYDEEVSGGRAGTNKKRKKEDRQGDDDGDETWTLLHDMCYLYHLVAIFPLSSLSEDEKLKNKSRIAKRFGAVEEKIKEWPAEDVDPAAMTTNIGLMVFRDIANDINISEKIDEIIARINEFMEPKGRRAVLDDLRYIVGVWSPDRKTDAMLIDVIVRQMAIDDASEKTQSSPTEQDDTKPAEEEFLDISVYPGDYYFTTEKYSKVPIRVKNFYNLSGLKDLFRKFSTDEIKALVEKIRSSKTIPKLSFVRNILEEKYTIPVKGAPFWFIPFVVLAEGIGGFVYFDRNGLMANYDDPTEIKGCMSWDDVKRVVLRKGFHHPDDVPASDEGFKIEVSFSFEDEAEKEYPDPYKTVSTLVLKQEEVALTINEFHGEEHGPQVAVMKAIWDLWKIVVDYAAGSPIWPLEDKVPGGPNYKNFDSWDELLAWARSDEESINEEGSEAARQTKNDTGEDLAVDQYRKKVTEVLADGVVTELEQAGLDFSQKKLKLSDTDAMRIFDEVISEMEKGRDLDAEPAFTRETDTVIKKKSSQAAQDEDIDEPSGGKRITYDSWDDYAREQSAKDPLKKEFMPIAKGVHDLIVETFRNNNMAYDIRFGDGTFSFSVPRELARSRARTCAAFGLLNFKKDSSYLEKLYKHESDDLPKGARYSKKSDHTLYQFLFSNLEDFQNLKGEISRSVIRSYQMLASDAAVVVQDDGKAAQKKAEEKG